MSSKEPHFRALLNHTIANYHSTSRSKKFHRVNPKNELRILAAIRAQGHEKMLTEILQKKDYYTNKALKIIHESIDDAEDQQPSCKKPPFFIEPQHIANRHHAKRYIVETLLLDGSKTAKIRHLIQKQALYLANSRAKRDAAQKHYEARQNTEPVTVGLAKLSSSNSLSHSEKNKANANDLDETLAKLDSQMAHDLAKMARDSEAALYELNVPFFAISETHTYPEIQADKAYVLDLLSTMVP